MLKQLTMPLMLLLLLVDYASALRLAAGSTDKEVGFVARDATNFHDRETGFSSFTVVYAIDGGTDVTMSTPTILEADSSTLPGVYWLTVDEGGMTTLQAGDDTAELIVHITHAGMDPVTRVIEIYRPKITEGQIVTASGGNANANMVLISGDSTAADNLESMFDGTGYNDDNAPSTQLQISTLAGGIAVSTIATGRVLTEGEETLTYTATATRDSSYYEVASDSISDDIDVHLIFNTGSGDNLPVTFHMDGYYEDNNAPANSTLLIQAYNFNIAAWDTIDILSDSASPLALDLPLHVHDVDPSGGNEGDVHIRFKLVATEVSQNIRIDHATVGYVSGGLTVAAVADGVWDEDVVLAHDVANSAGFLLETVQSDTTIDLPSQISDAHIATDTDIATVQALLDTSGTLYDNIVSIKAFWDSLTITGGLLEIDLKKLDGTAVKSTSGNIHALPGNI